ncbi:MAG: NAD-dependent epimerase/dehydratase family protein [Actinobacteria bacterium]|nr:MAG: NAD-dependent epimerase/dehydratase family protein [Actinomycetota bacterium]
MSPGSAPILLLKAAPEPEQLADRLDGGPWQGLEVPLMPAHVADDAAIERAIANVRAAAPGAVTAEAPVAWPSGAHVRVDRLDDEARAGIERSARFAAGVGSPVLTIHLFIPMDPVEYRAHAGVDEEAVGGFLRFYADACLAEGVTPLIENVPPVLRMRTGGVFLSPVGGHWEDLLAWRAHVPEVGFTIDTSHAALFRSFAAAYPSLFGLESDEGLELERYVEELGPAAEVAHVSDAAGLLGEGLPYGEGELDLDPVVRRLAELVTFVVAEINEPDHERSPHMKAGYRAMERALRAPAEAWRPPPRRLPGEGFDWQRVVARRDPVPALLELEERLAGRRVLITGGAGSIGRALATLILGFRPGRLTLLDSHEASLAADRRSRDPLALAHTEYVLCDVRDRERTESEMRRAAPEVVFHLAAYKHVDLAERFPEEYVATNLDGSWNVLRAAGAAGTGCVVVASTDKAALAASRYGRTKRLMEQLAAVADVPAGAVRLVNVLGSAGSASELFLRQARAGVPLTVTDTTMIRYWITRGHAASLVAHAALLVEGGCSLVTAADPVSLTVGELAERTWRGVHGPGEVAPLHIVGVRAGETMREVLIGPAERLEGERLQGAAPIAGVPPADGLADAVAALDALHGLETRRAHWLELLKA